MPGTPDPSFPRPARHTPDKAPGDASAELSGRAHPFEVRVQGISKSFGDHAVLHDISVDITQGELVAIVGPSGTGKTVLMHIMAGLLEPDAGRVFVADHSDPSSPLVELARLDEDGRDRVRMHWAVVFQRNALFSGSVYENVALLLREHTTLDEPAILARARESLKAAALDPDDVLSKDRDELSGVMAKRVAIARAIAIDPALIFYDEPTTGLDPATAGQIQDLIWETHYLPRGIMQDGNAKQTEQGHHDGQTEQAGSGPQGNVPQPSSPRTSIIVTHDKELLRRLHPRVIMLQQTSIVFDAPYEDLADCPAAQEYLKEMPVLHARPPAT